MANPAEGHGNWTTAMSLRDFCRLRDFIYSKCGIKITDTKKTMLEARLQRRLRGLRINSFTEYCDYLFSDRGMKEEVKNMINQVTTNKTDFFREPSHFAYLRDILVPQLLKKKRSIVLWSAGCSSGEEPYTLAMVLQETGCDFIIMATDISTKVLDKARLAVYDAERLAPVPPALVRKYFMASKNKDRGLYRIVPELRERVRFERLNFMDNDFGFQEEIDIIFCRNVVIYFDKATQERLIDKFCRCLTPHGYLFMGHSETLLGMDVPLVQAAPTIYKKTG